MLVKVREWISSALAPDLVLERAPGSRAGRGVKKHSDGMPSNLLAHYFYLWEPTVVRQAIETAWISASSGRHSLSYWCQQDSVFARDRRTVAECAQQIREAFRSQFCGRAIVNAVLIAIENRVRLTERIGQFMN